MFRRPLRGAHRHARVSQQSDRPDKTHPGGNPLPLLRLEGVPVLDLWDRTQAQWDELGQMRVLLEHARN